MRWLKYENLVKWAHHVNIYHTSCGFVRERGKLAVVVGTIPHHKHATTGCFYDVIKAENGVEPMSKILPK